MAEKEEKGVAFIFGIISIVMAFFQPLAGIVFGIIGLAQNKKEKSKKARKLNVVGIVLSAILFIASLVATVLFSLSNNAFPI